LANIASCIVLVSRLEGSILQATWAGNAQGRHVSITVRACVCDNSISLEELLWQEVSPNHELWRGGLVSKLQSGEGGKKEEKIMSLAPLLCSSAAPPCLEFVVSSISFTLGHL
jgi:hypothetical protein